MYHKLARGYATAYLEKLRPYNEVNEWFNGPQCVKAMLSFERSALAKKPGRVSKRLVPFLKPVFLRPRVGVWTREEKMVISEALSVATESQVLDIDSKNSHLFSERSVFFSNLFLTDDDGQAAARLITLANISHHALSRIVEREMVKPGNLGSEAKAILGLARNLAMAFASSSMDPNQAFAFLIPYRDGALPIVTMKTNPNCDENSDDQWVMSVRTFLSGEMINAEHRARMEGCYEAMAKVSEGTNSYALSQWMKENGRPWLLAPNAKRSFENAVLSEMDA